jgi:nitroreductase/NAD-dependent dihydropyrimidine dehydrogenase PreA subunit
MIRINEQTCKSCGICGHVCPRHVLETIEQNGEKVTVVSSERIGLCMSCGQCAAVCPTASIQIKGFNFDEFRPIGEMEIGEHQLLTLMEQRRSIRRYKDKPVPRETLDSIIEGAHRAPTGTGRATTGVIVIDDKERLRNFSKIAYDFYEKLGRNLKNPIARFFIKKNAGAQMFGTLQNFVMPGMQWYIRWYREGKSEEILRDCPALILFHSPVSEPMGKENCIIAAFHSIFVAETIGIGTCFNDLIPPACNRVEEIRNLLALPPDREVYASLTLGYPKYKYKRVIPRRLAEVRYLN